jgi:hypothetical protein
MDQSARARYLPPERAERSRSGTLCLLKILKVLKGLAIFGRRPVVSPDDRITLAIVFLARLPLPRPGGVGP